MRKLKLGMVVNPYAGVGGPAGQKGSDNADIQELAASGSLQLRAAARAEILIRELIEYCETIQFLTVPGKMGQCIFETAGVDYELVECSLAEPSTGIDTQVSARNLASAGVDILLFVGGDGTARDVYSALGREQLVLGVPSGVKMHSGVFAISPIAAAEIIRLMVSGAHVGYSETEVCDIDEKAFQQGKVVRKCFGYMSVPAMPQYVQHVKQGGAEVEELVLQDIAAEIRERLEEDDKKTLSVFGPGSTTEFIKSELGDAGTLLGVDVMLEGDIVLRDANSEQLLSMVKKHITSGSGDVKLIVTIIGGQGHIVGRGNQQFSPELLKLIGRENIWIVSTLTKLESLSGRPLQMDSNDVDLDSAWSGLMPVITGYRDERLYPLGLYTSETKKQSGKIKA